MSDSCPPSSSFATSELCGPPARLAPPSITRWEDAVECVRDLRRLKRDHHTGQAENALASQINPLANACRGAEFGAVHSGGQSALRLRGRRATDGGGAV